MKLLCLMLSTLLIAECMAYDLLSGGDLAKLMESHSFLGKNLNEGICVSIKEYLDAGADPDTATQDNLRALHLAAQYGDLALITALTRAGAEINPVTGNLKWTPLHFATYNKQAKAVTLLTTLGADVDAKANNKALLAENNETELRCSRFKNLRLYKSEPLGKRILKYSSGKNNINFRRQILLIFIHENKALHESATASYPLMKLLPESKALMMEIPKEVLRHIIVCYIKNLYPLSNR